MQGICKNCRNPKIHEIMLGAFCGYGIFWCEICGQLIKGSRYSLKQSNKIIDYNPEPIESSNEPEIIPLEIEVIDKGFKTIIDTKTRRQTIYHYNKYLQEYQHL